MHRSNVCARDKYRDWTHAFVMRKEDTQTESLTNYKCQGRK